jgi:hypothetical protein
MNYAKACALHLFCHFQIFAVSSSWTCDDVEIGAVLSQLDDEGREKVIAYGNRALSKVEGWYCVTRRELLAVVEFTSQYRPYLIRVFYAPTMVSYAAATLPRPRRPYGTLAGASTGTGV